MFYFTFFAIQDGNFNLAEWIGENSPMKIFLVKMASKTAVRVKV